jgi:hypothetical protein
LFGLAFFLFYLDFFFFFFLRFYFGSGGFVFLFSFLFLSSSKFMPVEIFHQQRYAEHAVAVSQQKLQQKIRHIFFFFSFFNTVVHCTLIISELSLSAM